jgi:hypothetical protein
VGELGAEGGQDTAVGRAAAEGGGSSQPPQEHGARRDGMQIDFWGVFCAAPFVDFWGVFCAAPFSRLFQLIFLKSKQYFSLTKISQHCFSAGLSAQPNGSPIWFINVKV